jgi:hypothetical protein
MPVSERTKRQRAYADRLWLEKQQAEAQKLAEQRAMFPSALPGSRGAVSPLGGVAKAAQRRKH